MSSRKQSAEIKEKEFGRRTRKIHSTEEKVKVVLEGLKEQSDIAELCRKENITLSLYRSWSKEFIEALTRKIALREGFGDLLPSAEVFVIDEAHQLPEVASRFFGKAISSRQINLLVSDVIAEQLQDAPDMSELRDIAESVKKAASASAIA